MDKNGKKCCISFGKCNKKYFLIILGMFGLIVSIIVIFYIFEYSKISSENDKVKRETPSGSTAIYPTVELALKEVSKVDRSAYNTSVILMTDGAGNIGTYQELERYYKGENLDIPVYSIQFAAARRDQLDEIARLTNGKVFDGTTSLIDAFMEVRGYN